MIESMFIDGYQVHGVVVPGPAVLPGVLPGSIPVGLTSFEMGSPAPRTVTEVRPSAHGVTDATAFYGPRTFELVGRVLAPSPAALWGMVDDLKGALRLGTHHVLKFRREGLTYDERCMVRVDGPVDIPLPLGTSRMAVFGVSLLAPDPRIYTDTQSTGSYDPTDTGGGGLGFDLTFDLEFVGSDGSATLDVVNEGNMDTPPAFTITGPVVNPRITNETTGESIYTTGLELASGATVEIDVAARSCLLGGTTARPDLIDASLTTWFNLEPGTNQLRMSGTGMSAGLTQLDVEFRSARI